ncbi:hypothetical protein B9Z55_012563 [Caenorhabditis nigoni]|uniref:Uncharacterized protein n=1 Tax=Caenorhabditis nigoni TaxID=1611254 RepID=A0A2G5TXQ5_9PELO|nr:hypothetical protein B9Z55_012563 [Caenorhabditis nigoni]
MKLSLIFILLAILIFFRCVSSQELDDDFFSSLEFPDVRNIREGFQTNASDFEMLEEGIKLPEESMELPDDKAYHRHPKNLKNSREGPNVRSIDKATQTNASDFDILEEDIEMPEESMNLPDDSTLHRNPKNLKKSKPSEQMNIVISIVITVFLILLLVIVVVLGPCVLLIIVLILVGLSYYAIRKILKYLEDRRFRAPNRASVGFEMREF